MRVPLSVAAPAALVACALLSAGCASAPPPNEQLAVAAASVDAAGAAGAAQHAPVELNGARAKLEQARRLAQARDFAKARELAEQADVDAQVARSKAGAQRSQLALAEVEEGLRLLREELERAAPQAPGLPPAAPLPPPTPTPAPTPVPAPAPAG
jgi:hypothetical protein